MTPLIVCVIHFVGVLIIILDKPGTTFHFVRTHRCTRVTDLNSVNQNTHYTFCCGIHIFTNEVSVTSLLSTIAKYYAHVRPIGLHPKPRRVFESLDGSLLHSDGYLQHVSSLTRIVARKHKQSLSQITSEVNSHLRNPISARTVQRELHASNLYGRVGICKPLVTARHALQRRQWCRTHRQWTPQQWQQVICSDESTFTLFQTTGRVYVWRTPKEAFAPECIVSTVKHGGGSLMVWGAISWCGLGPLVTLHGKVKAAHYVNNQKDQVHPFVQTSFPGECPLYQDDNAPIHTAKIVQEWFAEHAGEVGHLDWPPQSPDLSIIEHLWGYLESKLRAQFPPPSTILVLETALHEKWLHITLQVVQDLYASIPRRIQSVIQSKGVQLPINKAFLLFHRCSYYFVTHLYVV
ncbi:transposable element Tcb1 transposase [Trichonephila clavipes]|nr:transposable element Tcb1 transposase [Trichonephila clavipes]